jgi:alkanesulfonate monooxygenase SsuD/methylene tetrahydromethanopterin reductase-like flavin-dependent oxidoreductase (luciferase family)
MKFAGRKGFQPFAHCLVAGNVVADLWQTYEAAALKVGGQPDRKDFRVCRSIFLADTTKEARERVRSTATRAAARRPGAVGGCPRGCRSASGRRRFPHGSGRWRRRSRRC